MRTRDGDVSNGFVDLEELETLPGKLLAEIGHDLDWETHLVIPGMAQKAMEQRIVHRLDGCSGKGVGIDRLDHIGQMGFAEMLLDLFAAGELDGFGNIKAGIFGAKTLLF